ncbi:response regulator transcription factor [Bengtsoniella intestinalis]|uniref:response regulator transcription factor n=1 Tax=Bengtsoniella intestinalis TaxID=3073143 RepID=UPI00391F1FE5
MKTKVLIVEDEADLAVITSIHLEKAGHQTRCATTCQEALEYLTQEMYDLVVMDEMLPDGTGHDVCAKMQKMTWADGRCPPVLFTSCEPDSFTIIKALSSGGDDYMVKPIHYPEFLARVEALLRRSGKHNQSEGAHMRQFATFSLDTNTHQILREGQAEELSPVEYRLLCHLIDHPNTLLLYDALYQSVWDSDSLGDNRTVMVHISNLRKKIDPYGSGVIATVRNAGYIFNHK